MHAVHGFACHQPGIHAKAGSAIQRQCIALGFAGVLGSNSQRSLVDGAAGVADIAHRVVAAAIAIADRYAADGDSFVALPGVFVEEGKAAAAEAVAVEHRAVHHLQRAAGHAGRAVIGFAHVLHADGELGLGNVRFQTRGLGDGVVGRIGPVQGHAADGHRLVRAHVLVGKAAAGPAERDGFTCHHASQRAAAKGGGGAAVIGFVARRHAADGQRGLVDGAAGVADIAHRVVAAAIAIADRYAADGDSFVALPGVFVEEGKAAAAEAVAVEHRAVHHLQRAAGHAGRAVIGFAHVLHADGELGLGNVRRGAGLAGDEVVARIGAAVAAGQRHGLAIARVLVAEDTRGGHVQFVVLHQPGQHGAVHIHGGGIGAVISLVAGRDAADGQDLGRDIRRQIRGCRHGVIARIGPAQRDVADGHGLARAHVLVGKTTAGAAAQGHGIAIDHAGQAAAAQAGGDVAVIDLVARRHAADGQRLLADLHAVVRAVGHGVVACIVARQGIRHGCGARACVFAVQRGAGYAQGNVVAAVCGHGAFCGLGQHIVAAVVGAACHRGAAHGQRLLADLHAVVRAVGHGVVACIVARQGIRHGCGARACVFAVQRGAGYAQGNVVAAVCGHGAFCGLGQHIVAAVVGTVCHGGAGDGQRFLGDGQAGIGIGVADVVALLARVQALGNAQPAIGRRAVGAGVFAISGIAQAAIQRRAAHIGGVGSGAAGGVTVIGFAGDAARIRRNGDLL